MAERALQFSPRSILKFLGNQSAILGQEQSSDLVWDTLLFPQGQQRSCFVSVVLPPLWDGGDITLRLRLSTPSAGGDARFIVHHAVLTDGDNRDAATSSVFVAATDLPLAGSGVEEDKDLQATPLAVPEDVLVFEVQRLGTHPNDTAGDVKLLGLSILYEDGTSGVGEENTLSSVGAGVSIVKGKVGVDLRTKSLTAGSNITLTGNADDVEIAASGGGEANTASNVGGGEEIFKQKTGVNLELKTLVAGANITLTPATDTVTVAASAGSGETNTASNVGAGSQVFKQKTGVDLEFRSLVQGANVTLTQNTNDVTIAAASPGEVNTATNVGVGANVYKSKTGVQFNLRSVNGGVGVSVVQNTDDITISTVEAAKWEETFALDFTAETPVDIKAGGDGPYTLGGVSFEALNTGSSTVFEVGASGLDIQTTTSGASNFSGARSAPILYALLEDLIPVIDGYDEYRLTFDFDFVGTPTANYELLTAGFHSDNAGNYAYTQGLFTAGHPDILGMHIYHVTGAFPNPATYNRTFASLGHTPGGARLTWGQHFVVEVSTQTFAAESDIDAMAWRTLAMFDPSMHIAQWDFQTAGLKPIVMFSFDLTWGSGLCPGFRVRKMKIERRTSPHPVTVYV